MHIVPKVVLEHLMVWSENVLKNDDDLHVYEHDVVLHVYGHEHEHDLGYALVHGCHDLREVYDENDEKNHVYADENENEDDAHVLCDYVRGHVRRHVQTGCQDLLTRVLLSEHEHESVQWYVHVWWCDDGGRMMVGADPLHDYGHGLFQTHYQYYSRKNLVLQQENENDDDKRLCAQRSGAR